MAETTAPDEAERQVRHRLVASRDEAAETDEEAQPTSSRLWGSVSFWRGTALLAGAVAILLAAAMYGKSQRKEEPVATHPQRYVALLQDTKPRWLVTINVSAGTMMAEPIEAEIPSGQTAELWLTPKSGNPQSLGLLDAKATILRPLPPALIGNAPESAAVSITLEPSTGSPTGAPTGAVLYRAASIRQAL
jgi:anti-sigma-K factor RskA